jgi:hypothetical protein
MFMMASRAYEVLKWDYPVCQQVPVGSNSMYNLQQSKIKLLDDQ